MLSTQMMPASNSKWDDLSLNSQLSPSQLNKIATDLDSIAIALAALAQIGETELRQTAQDLQLESIVLNWLNSWSSHQTALSQQLDLEQMRSLVLIVSHLAQAHQTLVRRNINYWEQTIEHHHLPLQSPSLAEYISNFIQMYRARLGNLPDLSIGVLSEAALALLIELLFYSSPNGHQRLWSSLLQRAQS
jgi:Protein of unknown function (DUF3038)